MIHTTNLPRPAICSACKSELAQATGTAMPYPGALVVCYTCTAINVFTDDLSLAPADLASMHPEAVATARRIQSKIRQLRN